MTNNPELSNDRINGLSRRVYELEQELKAAKGDIEQLRKLIRQATEIGPNDGREFSGWETFNILHNWATK